MALSGSSSSTSSMMTRSTLLRLIHAAVEVKAEKFARQAALTWLAAYPGDLEINFLLAMALKAEGKPAHAANILEKVVSADPENRAAYQLLAEICVENEAKAAQWWGAVFALSGAVPANVHLPDWSRPVRECLRKLEQGKITEAEAIIHVALAADDVLPLIDLIHLKVNRVEKDWLTVRQLVELYHDRWPECLAFQYMQAELAMESGDEAGAVLLLHECVTRDASGVVAKRWLSSHQSYRPLWPEDPTIRFDLPVPAEVASKLGMNSLPMETTVVSPPAVTAPDVPETAAVTDTHRAAQETAEPKMAARKTDVHDAVEMQAIKGEFEKLAKRLKKPAIGQADGRFPVYVILSSRTGLINQYGAQSAEVLFAEMNHLAEMVRRRQGWGALAYLPDDPVCTTKLGIAALDNQDPWQIKLALKDLDQALAHRGERIGALLIVGGEQIVPFHKLPNPTEDADTEVPSDNPYASTDANYFVTEWLVGRLPGEAGTDAGLLLQQIRQCARFHEQRSVATRGWKRTVFYRAWQSWRFQRLYNQKRSGFGYSAAAWRRSSLTVFRSVAPGREIHISPPEITGSINPKKVTSARLNYYNLHGLIDSSEWYGQRDFSDPGSGPDYPVALTIDDLQHNGRAPSVVFSEACYGGHVIGKTEAQSLALRFLSIGVLGMIGSTCISYGSVGSPLVAADLLGQLFWKSLREGYTAGEALMLAKINLIREMNRRQGYLDGEDQKTVLSFVLYGDPLASADLAARQSKQALRMKIGLPIKTVDDQSLSSDAPAAIQSEWIPYAKKSVEAYLPGLENSKVQVYLQRPAANSDTGMPQKAGWSHKKSVNVPNRYVVTITKSVPTPRNEHTHYARVTLDEKGKMVKLAISR